MASKTVAWLGAALLAPRKREREKSFGSGRRAGVCRTPATEALPRAEARIPLWAAARVGSGTSSATADAAANTTHAIAKKIARAPDPVITPSPVPRHVRLAISDC